jgi:hypothetical protein
MARLQTTTTTGVSQTIASIANKHASKAVSNTAFKRRRNHHHHYHRRQSKLLKLQQALNFTA